MGQPLNYQYLAQNLDQALRHTRPIEQISHGNSIDLKDAYAIQKSVLALCLQRGEKHVGWKMGFTSKAKMEQMGVKDMILGRLTNRMYCRNGIISRNKLIHPRAEPEIAFRIGRDVVLPLTLERAPDHTDGVGVAIEIIDSRYSQFKFSLEDVVADNCSSAAFVVGDWYPPQSELKGLNMTLQLDGAVAGQGNSNNILGNPWESLVAADRLVREYGETLKAGDIILAGAATAAVPVDSGQKVQAVATGLGKVFISVV